MTELPIQPYPIEPLRDGRRRAYGFAALCLIFCASAAFTWAYFSDIGSAKEASQAAAATLPATSTEPDAFSNLAIQAKSAIVVDETSGRVLYTMDPDLQWPLASLTKVPLVLAVSKALPLESTIVMPDGLPHFLAGTHWKLSDVINYTLAISSNDGADALAYNADEAIRQEYPAAPESHATVWRMNQLAHELGLSNTYFLNDNGLDESPTQAGAYGSARDAATLLAYAASTSPQVFAATTRQSFTIRSEEGTAATAINTDQALPAIPGIIMGKTGYTDLAGGNLGVVFRKNGHEIVAVVLGSTESGRFEDMKALVARVSEALK